LLIIAGATVFALVALRGSRRLSHTMLDGTVVTVEAMTLGKSHAFTADKAWRRWLRRSVPFTRTFLKDDGFGTVRTSTENDALVFWISHFDPKTGKYLDPKWEEFDVTDEHGCKFRINGWGTSHGRNLIVSHIAAEVFPRRQGKFRLHLRTRDSRNAQFEIENPVRASLPAWTAEPLPSTRTNGDLTIVLERVRLRGPLGNSYVSTEFVVRRDGSPTKDWDEKSVRLMDATGNQSATFLCTNEPAWKVSANFYRTPAALFSESEIWRVPKVRVPAEGEGLSLQRTGAIGSVQISLVAFAGAGKFETSNGVFIASSPDAKEESVGTSGDIMHVSAKGPFLLLQVAGLANEERLLIRGRDETGNVAAAQNYSRSGAMHVSRFDKPIEASVVDLEFIVNKPRHAEFIVKPPMLESRRSR